MTARWERLPLRVRLVAALVALVTVALAVAGYAATRSLRGYLLDRVDRSLAGVAYGGPRPNFGPDARGGRREPPTPAGYYLRLVNADGSLYTFEAPQDGVLVPDLPAITQDEADGQSFTMEDGGHTWRVVAVVRSDRRIATAARLIDDEMATVNRLAFLQLVIGSVVLAALGAIGSVVVRRSLRPLAAVEATAAEIAAGDLSRRVPSAPPETEVGRLSAAFNAMVERIEVAFRERVESEERMRRFVADASHELRTPLTSIRGFAELYRQGAADDVPRLMRRIEDEGARMGLLVDDLLLLARLDEERPLAREVVDLVGIASDAAHDARVLDPDREVTLDVGEGTYEVRGDEPRLRQVIGNLTSNALRYTPPGTPVEILLACDGDHARVDVVDHGPGLGEDAERVFERFWRADKARSRAEGGSGLGLAIVAAVTAAHGGTVQALSTPGGGATFRVWLPKA